MLLFVWVSVSICIWKVFKQKEKHQDREMETKKMKTLRKNFSRMSVLYVADSK